MPKKKRVRHHKHHVHLTAWMIFLAVVLVSVLAFYIFLAEKKNGQKTPDFGDYKISKDFSGKIESINYSSNEKAISFKDQIEEQIKNGVNFAGHYVLAIWDCGQNCKTGAVVDAFNGNIYDLPVPKACGLEFRKDSNLLIVNQSNECFGNPDSEKPRYFVFEE